MDAYVEESDPSRVMRVPQLIPQSLGSGIEMTDEAGSMITC